MPFRMVYGWQLEGVTEGRVMFERQTRYFEQNVLHLRYLIRSFPSGSIGSTAHLEDDVNGIEILVASWALGRCD